MSTDVLAAQGETFHDVAGIIHAGGAACALTLGLIEATYKGSRVGRFLARLFPRPVSPGAWRWFAAAVLVGGGVVLGATALRSTPLLARGGTPSEQSGERSPSGSSTHPGTLAEMGGQVLVIPPFINSTDRRAPMDVDVATGDGLGAPTRSVRVERYGRDAQDRTLQLLGDIKPDGVTLVDRSRFDRFLDEFKFSESGMVSQESAVRVGRQLGARFVLLGEVRRLSITERNGASPDGRAQRTFVAETEIGLRLQNVETGEVIGTAKASGRSTKFSRLPDADMISGAFDDAFEKLTKDAKLAAALKKVAETPE